MTDLARLQRQADRAGALVVEQMTRANEAEAIVRRLAVAVASPPVWMDERTKQYLSAILND